MTSYSQDPNKWDNWVQFAWGVAFFVIFMALIAVFNYGFIETVSVNRYGSTSTDSQFNLTIWAICIGQSVAACMIAALFSMVNSIYKNTCYNHGANTFIEPAAKSAIGSVQKPDVKSEVLHRDVMKPLHPRVVRITDKSPVFDQAYVDWLLKSINGQLIHSSKDVKPSLRQGENVLTFIKPDDEVVEINIKLSNTSKLNITLSR